MTAIVLGCPDYLHLYVIILFDIEIDIKIGGYLFLETVFLGDFLCYIYNSQFSYIVVISTTFVIF